MVRPGKAHAKPIKRKTKSRWPGIIFYFALSVFLGSLVYTIFFSRLLAIKTIKVSGNRVLSEQDVSGEISSGLSGKFLGIIERNNILLFTGNNLEARLSARFPEIESVAVQKKFPNSLLVDIKERVPSLVVCGSFCAVLDEKAVAYERTDPDSPLVRDFDLAVLHDQSQKEVALGKQTTESDYLAYVSGLKNTVKSDMGLDLDRNFETPNLFSLDVRTRTDQGWGVYFNEEIPLEKEVGVLKAVLANVIPEGERPNLEYIDLRINGKVYYKMKGGLENSEEVKEEGADKVEKPAEADKNDKKDKKKKD